MTPIGDTSRSGRSRRHCSRIPATWSSVTPRTIADVEPIIPSMEAKGLILAAAAIAPVSWGAGYYVTQEFLPPDRPLFGALVRALPFGLLMLAMRPALPRGAWWWRAALL